MAGIVADALEDIGEVGGGVNMESFAGGDEAGEDGGGSPAFIAAEESRHGGISSDGNSPEATLGAGDA